MYDIPSLGLIPDVTGEFVVLQHALDVLAIAWLGIVVVGFLVIIPLATRQSEIDAPLEVRSRTAGSATQPAVGLMARTREPGIVTRLLETVEVHVTAASELFVGVCAICGLAVLVRALIAYLA
jgi:hypothetical protein